MAIHAAHARCGRAHSAGSHRCSQAAFCRLQRTQSRLKGAAQMKLSSRAALPFPTLPFCRGRRYPQGARPPPLLLRPAASSGCSQRLHPRHSHGIETAAVRPSIRRPSMSYFSRLTSACLAATLLVSGASPTFANYQREEMIRQQRAECDRLGGRYEYPKCYLPERDPTEHSRSNDSSCGVGCAVVLGVLGIAAARQAYCKANPGKC